MLVVVDGSIVTLLMVSEPWSSPGTGVLFVGYLSYAQYDIDHIMFPSADLATTS